MQVNSVSSANVQSFGHRQKHQNYTGAQMLTAFADMSDRDIQKLAYAKASKDVNDKRFNRVQNGIFYGIPIAFSLSAALSNSTKLLAKPGYLRGTKLAVFAGTAAKLVGAFLTFDLTMAGKRSLEKHSQKANDFASEHPFLSLAAGIGAFAGILALGSKGISKLSSKSSNKVSVSTLKTIVKINNKLNNNKVLNTISKGIDKVPSAIKSFSKGLLSWTPAMLIATSVMNTISHTNAKTGAAYRNYQLLKADQQQVREALERADAPETEEEV